MLIKLLNRRNPYERDSAEWNCFEDIRCYITNDIHIPVSHLIDGWGMNLEYYETYLPVLELDGLIEIDHRTLDDIVFREIGMLEHLEAKHVKLKGLQFIVETDLAKFEEITKGSTLSMREMTLRAKLNSELIGIMIERNKVYIAIQRLRLAQLSKVG